MFTVKPLAALTAVVGLICASPAFAEGDQVAENNPIGDPAEDTYQNPYENTEGTDQDPYTEGTDEDPYDSAYAYAYNGSLENPQPNSAQSGIGVVSGWHCDAESIDFQIDDGRVVPAAYGTERRDTETVCGDADNGFVFLLNYSAMGDGPHTVSVYADGILFGSAEFRVTTLGGEFLGGLDGVVAVPDFPYPGDTTVLRWDEAKQNFSVDSVQ
jgi:hypothetical protein